MTIVKENMGKILGPNDPRPQKRKHVYCMSPSAYEIAPCPKCGGQNTTWSEYMDHIWCFDCQIDYIPIHHGVFDGPVPLGVSEMFGVFFHRIEIATGKLIKVDDPEFKQTWP